jgi:hypothetical protein
MKRAAVFATLLTGCAAATTGPQPAAPGASGPAALDAGAGCPAPSQVYIASFMTPAEPVGPAPSSGHTGWVVPLSDLKVVTTANQPEYAAIDATTAQALGVPDAPQAAWLMAPGQPPCKASLGSYYAAAVDSPEPNITYGVELTGCPVPAADRQQDAEAIVLASAQAPSDCQVLLPRPLAARLGDTDAQNHWQRPTKQTAIPPALAPVIPAHDCRPPGCEMLWAIAEVAIADRPVAWAGAVNWLTIPPGATPDSQCDWKAETFAGFFFAGPDGKASRVSEGQDHPLLLSAVLADRSGARAMVAEGPGEYAVYDAATGKPSLARHLTWLRLAPDAYELDERIGPSCESDR